MRKFIIIINGSGGVGKDTFVDLCSKYASVINYSSVKEIKQIATQFGWDGGKTEKDRKFLSDLKLLSADYSDFPYRCILKQIQEFLNQDEKEILFIHSRNIPEIARVVKEFSHEIIFTLLITRGQVEKITSNIADADVENYDYDFTISNDGSINKLDWIAKNFVSFLRIMFDL